MTNSLTKYYQPSHDKIVTSKLFISHSAPGRRRFAERENNSSADDWDDLAKIAECHAK